MKFAFATLDVFTNMRFAGNPLTVFFDADDLDGASMHAVAREIVTEGTIEV